MDPYAPPSASAVVSSRRPVPTRKLVVSTILLAITVIGWIGMLVGFLLPRFVPIFEEFDKQIPPFTAWILAPWVQVACGGLMIGLIAWRYLESWRWWISPLIVTLFATHVTVVVVGLFLPLIGLIERLG